MSESWKAANERMACVDCGESGADPYTTVYGRPVRVCRRCLHRWEEFGLRERGPMYEEPNEVSRRRAGTARTCIMSADPTIVLLCERFACLLSRAACGTRFHAAIQRFAPIAVQGCLGCPVGAENVAFLPAEALTRRRGPKEAYRASERGRMAQRTEPRPDPRPTR